MRFEEPHQVVARLCELVERVARDHLEYEQSTDCFCRDGGFWRNGYDPVADGTWMHDDAALRYIEETVDARLALLWRAVKP